MGEPSPPHLLPLCLFFAFVLPVSRSKEIGIALTNSTVEKFSMSLKIFKRLMRVIIAPCLLYNLYEDRKYRMSGA